MLRGAGQHSRNPHAPTWTAQATATQSARQHTRHDWEGTQSMHLSYGPTRRQTLRAPDTGASPCTEPRGSAPRRSKHGPWLGESFAAVLAAQPGRGEHKASITTWSRGGQPEGRPHGLRHRPRCSSSPPQRPLRDVTCGRQTRAGHTHTRDPEQQFLTATTRRTHLLV